MRVATCLGFVLACAISTAAYRSISTAAAADSAGTIQITRGAAQKATRGPAEYFTGTATISSQFERDDPARVTGAVVSFEAGAHTAWHSHPLGQTLIVTAGNGLVQYWDGPVQEMRQGDVVWIPPNVKHWHGATSKGPMTHVAIQERLGGKNVTWMEKVSEQQYRSSAR